MITDQSFKKKVKLKEKLDTDLTQQDTWTQMSSRVNMSLRTMFCSMTHPSDKLRNPSVVN